MTRADLTIGGAVKRESMLGEIGDEFHYLLMPSFQ
jgi:hypothetical protein